MEEKKINCFYCKGNAILKHNDLALFEGKIVLKQQPYYECLKCKRDFSTNEQMKQTEKELNAFSILKPVISTGRSLAITLPDYLTDFYSIKKGTTLKLIPESRQSLKIIVCR